VTGRFPDLTRKNYGAIKTNDVFTRVNDCSPPLAFDVLFEFNSQRSVIPSGTGSTIDFTCGEDKSSALSERYN
jgi:hypothetical protein